MEAAGHSGKAGAEGAVSRRVCSYGMRRLKKYTYAIILCESPALLFIFLFIFFSWGALLLSRDQDDVVRVSSGASCDKHNGDTATDGHIFLACQAVLPKQGTQGIGANEIEAPSSTFAAESIVKQRIFFWFLRGAPGTYGKQNVDLLTRFLPKTLQAKAVQVASAASLASLRPNSAPGLKFSSFFQGIQPPVGVVLIGGLKTYIAFNQ